MKSPDCAPGKPDMPEAIHALLIEDNPIHARLIQKLLDDVDGQLFEVETADRIRRSCFRVSMLNGLTPREMVRMFSMTTAIW